jgi:hypothetical protein
VSGSGSRTQVTETNDSGSAERTVVSSMHAGRWIGPTRGSAFRLISSWDEIEVSR